MKQPKPTKKQKKSGKKTYKVRNWREYNQALVDRGKVIFWITEEAIRKWEEKEQKKKKRGKPRLYSNLAIEAALTLQQVLHLNLRQTEGFLSVLLKKMGSMCQAPDYSTLSIRSKSVSVKIRVRKFGKEPLHIVVDSTGAKVYGEGEWKVRQHGWSKHRTWKKLHLGVDEKSGDILMGEVTGNDTGDCESVNSLLEQVPESVEIEQVSADGAYDRRTCYETLRERKVHRVAIPPQKNAKIWQHGNSKSERLIRDENLRYIRRKGRKQWKKDMNYHRRSLVETTMFRLKSLFTDRVTARRDSSQRVQLLLRCKVLNKMTLLGMPDSYLVA
ncbi:MAG: IS5 family transposase [Parcubacteria group bacterium]|nr:IS5 family transposase [Parcubacteria group bacterium]